MSGSDPSGDGGARSTHFDEQGRAHMVDIGGKSITQREAVARGRIEMSREALDAITSAQVSKGDVIGIARIAGITAAKRTSDWIPLAHPLPLEAVQIDFEPVTADGASGEAGAGHAIEIEARVRVTAKTGAEMEALVAVSAAALTIYDMTKSIDRSMRIGDVCLVRKSGGKSGTYERPGARIA